MRILYDNKTGKIYYSVRDADWYWFEHTTTIPLTELYKEEDEINKTLCKDLSKIGNSLKVDNVGAGKYFIENGEVKTKAGWKDFKETFDERV